MDENGNQIGQIDSELKTGTATILVGGAGEAVTLSIGRIGDGADPTKTSPKAAVNTYDVFNRLVQVENEKGLSTYQYKPDGMRLSKTVNGGQTNHVWDGSNIVLEYNQNKSIVGKYTRGIGLFSNQNNNYFLFNAHGDVVQLTDGSANVTKNYHYDAYGNDIGITNQSLLTHQVGDAFYTADDAALAWGLTYNSVSIANNTDTILN